MLMRVEPYCLRYCRKQMAEFRNSLVQQCLAAHRRNRIRANVFRNRTMVCFVDVAMIGFDSLGAKFGWRSERYQCVFPSDCGKPAVLLFLLEDHRRVVLRWSLTCQRPQGGFARPFGVCSAFAATHALCAADQCQMMKLCGLLSMEALSDWCS